MLLKRLFDFCRFCLRLSVINIREYKSRIEEQWWVRVSCERFFLHSIYTSLHLSVRCSTLMFGVGDFDSNFMGCYLRESWILLIVDNLIFEIWKADLGWFAVFLRPVCCLAWFYLTCRCWDSWVGTDDPSIFQLYKLLGLAMFEVIWYMYFWCSYLTGF